MQYMPRISLQRGTWLVVVYATIQFFYAYWTNPRNPLLRLGIDAGWYDGPDQAAYLRLAESFARGVLPSPMHYPPGYPLLGTPFVALTPLDPFVIPNLILFVCTLVLTFRLACKFLAPELSLLALVLLSQDDLFLYCFVMPWNNTVTTLCLVVLLSFVAMPPRQSYLAAATVGLCLAWSLAARYGDVLLLVPPAMVALFRLASTWKERLILAIIGGLAAIPLVLWVGWLHYTIFGSPFITPYVLHHSRITGYDSQSMDSRSLTYIGTHIFSLFVNPLVFDRAVQFAPVIPSVWHRSLLSYYFVVLFAGIGFWFIQQQQRLLVVSFGASLALALLYFGSFWSTSPHDIKFLALRFFLPWQPMLVCAGVAGLIGLLHADWRVPANRRLIGAGLICTLLFGGGLYGLGHLAPPFPDWSRALPPRSWRASTSVDREDARRVFDSTVGTGWWAEGTQPAGTEFTVDMRQLYILDHLFLNRHAEYEATPVSVTITLSTDARYWRTPANLQVETREDRIMGFQFTPTEARYIRFTLVTDSTPAGWAIDELIVYGHIPAVVVLPGETGWYGEENVDEGPFRWLSSPAALLFLAQQKQQIALSFMVDKALDPASTMELSTRLGKTLMRFQVSPGRRIVIGPLAPSPGTTRLVLTVQRGTRSASIRADSDGEQSPKLAALSPFSVIYLEPSEELYQPPIR